MKFENTEVFNFEGAIRGMRNPLESWGKSDSSFGVQCDHEDNYENLYEVAHSYAYEALKDMDDETAEYAKLYDKITEEKIEWLGNEGTRGMTQDHHYTANYIGPNDLSLMKRLIKAGPEHRKFLRQIFVSVDITAPLYLWKEFDTYKVGTTANSTSTMHKMASKPITLDCFEIDDLNQINSITIGNALDIQLREWINVVIDGCEALRQKYLETKDKKYWKELIRWLPESWLQTRTVTLTYENILSMLKQRSAHKLNEWSGKDNPDLENFCSWAWSLPYAEELFKEVV